MSENFKDWSQKELINQIKNLESKLDDILLNKDNANFVQFEWAGNLGQWHWYVKENKVIFNYKKVETMGYDPKKVGKVDFQFFTDKLHPDDYDRVMDNMRSHLSGKSEAYEVEYRIKHKDGHYLWYYDRGSVIKRSDSGEPLLLQGIVFDISESKRIEEKLRYLSERDSLTNVYNRRTMYIKLEKLLENNKKQNELFSLIMFDIDHFKEVNDQYGHLVGDDVLKKLTEVIIDDKRSEDIVCRYGGEEFFLLLPNTNSESAINVAKRLRKMVKKMDVPKVGHITVSMGVVTYQKDETIDEVIKRADDLMYEAKVDGRDNIKF
ncbi:MAG: sensor domain-containing diguanylate cyclase [Tenericutes bacterium]|jgi:diguanylate cyclase (GGDEF)-like protein/PAS domain S-box-containing protein|nr:sensor domain-containing diguanylate cyclase [Mycoplasmatota bacterium]